MWEQIGTHLERMAVLVLAGFWRGRDFETVSRWFHALPVPRRRVLTALILGIVLGLAYVAAAFGPVGLGVYFLVIVMIVR